MKLRLNIYFVLFITFIILVACKQIEEIPQQSETPSNTVTPIQSTPIPTESEIILESPILSSPITTPEVLVDSSSEPPIYIPQDQTPQPDTGNVQGELVISGGPATSRVLYLAKVIKAGADSMGVASLDPIRDPRAESDSAGFFVFLNVVPGQYVLGINSPAGPILINRNGKEIKAEVKPNEILDLGKIEIIPFE
ncbi:MAG: hypothetical protein JXA42_20535 [Anaerolineales bacterium]|nr:hypothetical protein [Anaerolineales bacterium]